jgi:hypothetical protein
MLLIFFVSHPKLTRAQLRGSQQEVVTYPQANHSLDRFVYESATTPLFVSKI